MWKLLVAVAILLWPASALANPFVINEVVTDPQTVADDYIELKNITAAPASLDGWELLMSDNTPVTDCFGFAGHGGTCTSAAEYHVFDSAGVEVAAGTIAERLQAVPAGGYVLVINPSGDMQVTVTLELSDAPLSVIDDALINGNATSLIDETASRFPDGVDTDSSGDFTPLRPTPGASNGTFCAMVAGDLVINEVVSDAQQDWDGGTSPFDGTVGAGVPHADNDEYVEIKNVSAVDLDLRGCVLEMNDGTPTQLVLFDVTPVADPYVMVFDSSGAPVGGSGELQAVPAGGYVVVGNPPGAMAVNLTVRLRSAVDLDVATLALDAETRLDESMSRLSDGVGAFVPLAASLGQSNGAVCGVTADLVVNEVVLDPFQDWDDNDSATAFMGFPGTSGTVDANDEYIELKNTSTTDTLDVRGCIVDMTDGSPVSMVIQSPFPGAPYIRVFDDTGTLNGTLDAVPAGGYVLIGNPKGTMTSPLTVTLRAAADIDVAAVSSNSSSLLDESESRLPDGFDTDDPSDFVSLIATPGASNGACAVPPGEVVINEVVADPRQDWDHEGVGTPFDGTATAAPPDSDNDEYIELKNVALVDHDLRHCMLDLDDTSAALFTLQGIDEVADPYVRVFDANGGLLGGTEELDAVPAGGYVLIGNPPGTMNVDVVISLLSDVVIDTVAFSTDAPDLNSSTIDDEAGSRLPDGADTGVGVDDFRLQRATPGRSNELDECTLMLDDCHALASCANTAAGWDCTCPLGYVGDGTSCSDINECITGTDDCSENATCINSQGSFDCACLTGFTGDGVTCDDNDECESGEHDCNEIATCDNIPGSFTCTCPEGYAGDGVTCDDVDECAGQEDDCDDHAACSNTPGGFECTCAAGFSGDGRSCVSDDPLGTDEQVQNGVDDGCSCRTAGARTSPGWPLVLLLLGIQMRRARRRGPAVGEQVSHQHAEDAHKRYS